MSTEIQWKSISELSGSLADCLRLDEFRNYYSVSNTGLVRNNETGKILTPEIGKDNYRRIAMRVKLGKTNTSTRKIHIHKLVALAFLGEPENVKMQADHIDRDRANNNVENLRWLSGAENCRNRAICGRQKRNGKLWFDGEKVYFSEKDLEKFCRNRESLEEYSYDMYLQRLEIEDSLVFEDEKWKEIQHEDRKFRVSDKGRVFLEWYGKSTFGTRCDAGYFNITNRGKTYRVHRIVAIAFLGDRDGLVVNHKDNYGYNNRAENLEWTTVSDNLNHALKIGARKTRKIVRKDKDGEVKQYPSIQSAVDELGKDDRSKSRKALEACLKANLAKEKPTHYSQGYIWYYL